jgi:hypothetical protein
MTEENQEQVNENTNSNEEVNEIEKLKAEYDAKLEDLKGELKSRDAVIFKTNKEKEAKELASKTAEEKAELFEKKARDLERKENYRKSFKNVGLDPDLFLEIINETDSDLQAKKFVEILSEKTSQSANEALELFKKENLSKIPQEPNPKGEGGEDVIEQAFKRGLGLK